MKVSVLTCAAVFGLALAGCSTPPPPAATRASDTGSMAFPAPQPQGDIGSAAASGRRPTDTGSMAFPAPQPQGDVASTTSPQQPRLRRQRSHPTDTGSMAFPAPQPQGNLGSTQVR